MTGPLECMAALREFFSSHPRILEWGIAPAHETPNADRLRQWVDQGYHGKMDYMANRLRERANPQLLHPWAQSVIVFAFPYARPLEKKTSPSTVRYRVAAYAGKFDYHDEARELLQEAESFLKAQTGHPELEFYGFVDTAPVFERDLASAAGLGWRGKNCCTINRTHGSAFHLAGFLLAETLPVSAPVEDFCGGCTRCLDQCPTQAFTGPGQMDANKCISYWTIEAKTELPADLTSKFGGWIFGCDICQEVCPWNHKHSRPPGPIFPEEEIFPTNGIAWLTLLRKGGGFQSRFKRSPLARAGRKSLVRNIAVAARNLGDVSVLPQLIAIALEEEDPKVSREIERAISDLKGIFNEPEARPPSNHEFRASDAGPASQGK